MTEVLWRDETGMERICKIDNKTNKTKNNNNFYNLILPERNVLLEQLYFPENKDNQNKIEDDEIKKGMLLLYFKNDEYHEAYLSKIDWNSQSAQIRLIKKFVPKNQVTILKNQE